MNSRQSQQLKRSAQPRRNATAKSRRAVRGENNNRSNNAIPESKSDSGTVVTSSQLSDILSKLGDTAAPAASSAPSMDPAASTNRPSGFRQPRPAALMTSPKWPLTQLQTEKPLTLTDSDLTVFEIAAGLVPTASAKSGSGDIAVMTKAPPPPPPPPPLPPPARASRSRETPNKQRATSKGIGYRGPMQTTGSTGKASKLLSSAAARKPQKPQKQQKQEPWQLQASRRQTARQPPGKKTQGYTFSDVLNRPPPPPPPRQSQHSLVSLGTVGSLEGQNNDKLRQKQFPKNVQEQPPARSRYATLPQPTQIGLAEGPSLTNKPQPRTQEAISNEDTNPDGSLSNQKPRRPPPPPPKAGSPQHRKDISESLASALQSKRVMEQEQVLLAAEQARVKQERDTLKWMLEKQSKEHQRRIADLKRHNSPPEHRVEEGAISKIFMRASGASEVASPVVSPASSRKSFQNEKKKVVSPNEKGSLSKQSTLSASTESSNARSNSAVEGSANTGKVTFQDADTIKGQAGTVNSTPEQAVLSLMLNSKGEGTRVARNDYEGLPEDASLNVLVEYCLRNNVIASEHEVVKILSANTDAETGEVDYKTVTAKIRSMALEDLVPKENIWHGAAMKVQAIARMKSVRVGYRKLHQYTVHLQRLFRGELARKSFQQLIPLVQVQCLINRLGLGEAELSKFMLLCEDETGTVDLVSLEEMLRNHADSQTPNSKDERVLRELQDLVFNGTLTEDDVQEMIAGCTTGDDSSSSIDFDRLEAQYKHIRDAQLSLGQEAKEEEEALQSGSKPKRRKTLHEIEREIDTAVTDESGDHIEAVAQLIHTQLLSEDSVLEIVDACHHDNNGQVDVHRFKELFVEAVHKNYESGDYDELLVSDDENDEVKEDDGQTDDADSTSDTKEDAPQEGSVSLDIDSHAVESPEVKPPQSPQQPPTSPLVVGQDVQVVGLEPTDKYGHLISQHGLAMNLDHSTGLYHVMLDEEDAYLPIENLLPVSSPHFTNDVNEVEEIDEAEVEGGGSVGEGEESRLDEAIGLKSDEFTSSDTSDTSDIPVDSAAQLAAEARKSEELAEARAARVAEEADNIRQLSLKVIKAELTEYGVSGQGFLEKFEFVLALAEARTTKAMEAEEEARFRQRLVSFWGAKDPKKIVTIDDTLKEYKGKESKLFEKLERTYGPTARAISTEDQASSTLGSATNAGQRTPSAGVVTDEWRASNPNAKTFTSSDGTEFTTVRDCRKYDYELKSVFRKKAGKDAQSLLQLRKDNGDIDGRPFELHELQYCEVLLLDHSDSVRIQDLDDCRVFIGACSGTVLVRDCAHCTFAVACASLHIRNCDSCTFYCAVAGKASSGGDKPFVGGPNISECSELRFAPFNGAYLAHAAHLTSASLGFIGATAANIWFDIEDLSYNDNTSAEKSWRLLDPSEEEAVWSVESAVKMTTPTIPRVLPGEYPKLDVTVQGGADESVTESVESPSHTLPEEPSKPFEEPNQGSEAATSVPEESSNSIESFEKQEQCEYRETDGTWVPIRVVDKACDDDLEPYYVIAFLGVNGDENGREKHTVATRLRKLCAEGVPDNKNAEKDLPAADGMSPVTDGDTEQIKSTGSSIASEKAAHTFAVGDRVEVLFRDSWYLGTVHRLNRSGTYSVTYDSDGTKQFGVESVSLRRADDPAIEGDAVKTVNPTISRRHSDKFLERGRNHLFGEQQDEHEEYHESEWEDNGSEGEVPNSVAVESNDEARDDSKASSNSLGANPDDDAEVNSHVIEATAGPVTGAKEEGGGSEDDVHPDIHTAMSDLDLSEDEVLALIQEFEDENGHVDLDALHLKLQEMRLHRDVHSRLSELSLSDENIMNLLKDFEDASGQVDLDGLHSKLHSMTLEREISVQSRVSTAEDKGLEGEKSPDSKQTDAESNGRVETIPTSDMAGMDGNETLEEQQSMPPNPSLPLEENADEEPDAERLHAEVHAVIAALELPEDEVSSLMREYEDEEGHIDLEAFLERLKDMRQNGTDAGGGESVEAIDESKNEGGSGGILPELPPSTPPGAEDPTHAVEGHADEEPDADELHLEIHKVMTALELSEDEVSNLMHEFEDEEGHIDLETFLERLNAMLQKKTREKTSENRTINATGKSKNERGSGDGPLELPPSTPPGAEDPTHAVEGHADEELDADELHLEIHKVMTALELSEDEVSNLMHEFEDEEGHIDLETFLERLNAMLQKKVAGDAAGGASPDQSQLVSADVALSSSAAEESLDEELDAERLHAEVHAVIAALELPEDEVSSLMREYEDEEGHIDLEAFLERLMDMRQNGTDAGGGESVEAIDESKNEGGSGGILPELPPSTPPGAEDPTHAVEGHADEELDTEQLHAEIHEALSALELPEDEVSSLVEEFGNEGHINLEGFHARLQSMLQAAEEATRDTEAAGKVENGEKPAGESETETKAVVDTTEEETAIKERAEAEAAFHTYKTKADEAATAKAKAANKAHVADDLSDYLLEEEVPQSGSSSSGAVVTNTAHTANGEDESARLEAEIHHAIDALQISEDDITKLVAEFADEEGHIDVEAFHGRLQSLYKATTEHPHETRRVETMQEEIHSAMDELQLSEEEIHSLVMEFEDEDGTIDVESFHMKLHELKDARIRSGLPLGKPTSSDPKQRSFSVVAAYPAEESTAPSPSIPQSTTSGNDGEQQQIQAFLAKATKDLQLSKDEVVSLLNEAEDGEGHINLHFLHSELDERLATARAQQQR